LKILLAYVLHQHVPFATTIAQVGAYGHLWKYCYTKMVKQIFLQDGNAHQKMSPNLDSSLAAVLCIREDHVRRAYVAACAI
jgi:hypothetical protein